MLMRRFAVPISSVSLVLLAAGAAPGQNYPSKPIRIVAAAPGGVGDFSARLIAQGLTGSLGQPVVIENRPNGFIQYETVAVASPDGYTLLVTGNNLWIGPLLGRVPYDPVKSFSPITILTLSPLLLVVSPSLLVKSVKDLITLAKAKPGELNYASTGSGSPSHLAAELFKSMAGINMLYVPYKGITQGLNDLIAGRVQVMFPIADAAIPHVKSGTLIALAVTSVRPFSLEPGVPTMDASGLPGYEAAAILCMFAPAKTPVTIVNRLYLVLGRFLKAPEIEEKFLNAGIETVGSSPEELKVTMNLEMTNMGKVIRDAGIKAE